MRYQSRYFTCGPATLYNVFQFYGKDVPEDECCEFSVKGTSMRQLIAGIEKHGFNYEVLKTRDSFKAYQWLDTSIRLGSPVILCVDNWEHWMACIGKCGDKWVVADTGDLELVVYPTIEELMERWKHDNRYYAIAVTK